MKKSKMLITSAVLATLYGLYIISHFSSEMLNSQGAEAVGVGVATMLVIPHMLCSVLGAIFSVIAVVTYKEWTAIVALSLYYIACVLFPLYAMFTLPIGIIATIGWVIMKKQLNQESINS